MQFQTGKGWKGWGPGAKNLIIGLGLLFSLMALVNSFKEAQRVESPFDEVGDPGASQSFVSHFDFTPQAGPREGQAVLALAPEVLTASGATSVAGQDHLPGKATPVVTGWIPERILIPAIRLDAPILPVWFKEIQDDHQTYRQWLAPDFFAVGWHATSALLGVAGNTVLNGHHNTAGEVFGHLADLQKGDLISVYSGERSFEYVIVQKLILPERFEPLEVRLANAMWIEPVAAERLTLITCWPYESNTHRLIIVAKPASAQEIQNLEVIPRLTPHPIFIAKPTLTVTVEAPLEQSATASQ